MPSRFHVITKAAFDQYDRAGCRAILSEAGYAAMMDAKRGKPHLVEVEAEQLDNGALRFDDGEPIAAKHLRDKAAPILGPDGKLVEGWRERAEKAPRMAAEKPAGRVLGAPRGNRQGGGPNASR